MTPTTELPFWETKSLSEMSDDEWESLCDGCAQCCQLKFSDCTPKGYFVSPVVCKLLDLETCQCKHYESRHFLVPDCLSISAETASEYDWLPQTCAYRLLAIGKPLESWHPLIAGNREEMDRLGISVKGRVLSEKDIHPKDLEEQVLRWTTPGKSSEQDEF